MLEFIKVKDLEKVKTIISQNITSNLVKKTFKIDQLLFIKDLLEEINLISYNVSKILILGNSFIKITEADDYKEVNLTIYQQLIKKLIYQACKIMHHISFVVKRLSNYNIDFYKGYHKKIV